MTAAAGATLSDAVRCTVYLTDMGDIDEVNEAYAGYFGDGLPARVNHGVTALPLDALVNIDAIIALPA